MKIKNAGIRALLTALTIAFGVPAPAQTPQNIVITSAASFQAGLPPKGSLGTIFCTGLQVQGTIGATTIPLPRTLGAVSVTIGGAPAPLLAVASQGTYQMINFQVPQEAVINPDNTAAVVVAQNGHRGSAQAVLSTSPGDFFMNSDGYAAFLQVPDLSPVTKDKPAQPGDALVCYMTGLPGTQPIVPTGEPTPLIPDVVVPQPQTPAETDTFSISIGGVEVTNSAPAYPLSSIDLVPGLEGVYRIEFTVPPGLPPGDAKVFLIRTTCTAIFGSCVDGGGITKVTHGASVLLPIR